MKVAIAHPGAVLAVGDLSHRDGGPIAGHRAHQSGRDVDLTYYAVSERGEPFVQDEFLGDFRADGRADSAIAPVAARKIPVRYFDARRNWALVEALITDPYVVVRHIFVSKRVEAWILAEAKSQGAKPDLLARAKRIMHRPRHVQARTHNDHMHVQIRCSQADARSGSCIEGPRLEIESLETWLGCPRVVSKPVARALDHCRELPVAHAKMRCRRRALLARECPAAKELIDKRKLLDFSKSSLPLSICSTWMARESGPAIPPVESQGGEFPTRSRRKNRESPVAPASR